jgi:vacuolar-type H+-ATPase subunit F/Vma7
MISMLERLAVTHVGLVYIDDAYGQGGKIQLLEEISNRNICVQNPISVRQNMPKDYIRDVINKLYNQQVRVVLLFIIDSVAQQILDVVNEFIQKRFPPLVFISSEGWGSNLNLLTRTSLGSVVFNIAAQSYTTGSYRTYLKSLRPWQNQENRWLPRYFEDYNRCDNLTSFEKTFIERNEAKICGDGYKSTLDTNTTESLAKDQRYFHTMLSVYALTNGYQKFCPEETSCSPLAVRGRPSTFFAHIKSTKYGDNIPIFDEDGNGHIGFTIHNIQLNRTSGIYYYKRVHPLFCIDKKQPLVFFICLDDPHLFLFNASFSNYEI